MKKLSLKNLSFVLIHAGLIFLILSCVYGLFVSFKYGEEIKLEYPFIVFSYFTAGTGLLIWTILTAMKNSNMAPYNKEKRGILIKIILIILAVNASIALFLIIMKFILIGYIPFAFFGGTFLFISCFMSVILIYLIKAEKNNLFSLFSLALIFIVNAAAVIFNEPAKSFPRALNSFWFYVHVTSSMAAYAFLFISFVMALVYIINKARFKKFDMVFSFGFFFYFLLLVTGSIWAQNAWGSYWSWDPKESAALAAFLVYAFGVHVRGKWRYYLNIAGFLFLIFCYLGVTFLMKGLHSY